MNETTQTDRTAPIPQTMDRRRARTRVLRATVIVIALAAAVADWLLSAKIIGLQLIIDQGAGDQPIQPALVAAAPIAAGLAGWLLLAILERFAPQRAGMIWRIIATVVLVLSLSSPISAAQSVSTAVALVSMHLVVGAILIIGLPRRATARS